MRLIDGDELLYKVNQIKYLRKLQAKSLVEECKEIKAIPIEYIQKFIDLTTGTKIGDDITNLEDYLKGFIQLTMIMLYEWEKENESNISN